MYTLNYVDMFFPTKVEILRSKAYTTHQHLIYSHFGGVPSSLEAVALLRFPSPLVSVTAQPLWVCQPSTKRLGGCMAVGPGHSLPSWASIVRNGDRLGLQGTEEASVT